VLLLLCGSGWAQSEVSHASTLAQCQADHHLWLARDDQGMEEFHKLTIPQLRTLQYEMRDCQAVDPSMKWNYYNMKVEFLYVEADRLEGFLFRHHLYDQFIQEDAAGKR